MTLHAQGLEFPQVYLVGMEEGLLPHRGRSRRATRSTKSGGCATSASRGPRRLTLSLAPRRMKWGKPRETIPSRFLFEMTGQAATTEGSASAAGTRPLPARGEAARPRRPNHAPGDRNRSVNRWPWRTWSAVPAKTRVARFASLG